MTDAGSDPQVTPDAWEKALCPTDEIQIQEFLAFQKHRGGIIPLSSADELPPDIEYLIARFGKIPIATSR